MIHDDGFIEEAPVAQCGYKSLWIAVLNRAWLDIVQPRTIGPGLDHQLDGALRSQKDAVEWALGNAHTVGSLQWICDAAELPQGIVSQMQALARRAISTKTSR